MLVRDHVGPEIKAAIAVEERQLLICQIQLVAGPPFCVPVALHGAGRQPVTGSVVVLGGDQLELAVQAQLAAVIDIGLPKLFIVYVTGNRMDRSGAIALVLVGDDTGVAIISYYTDERKQSDKDGRAQQQTEQPVCR